MGQHWNARFCARGAFAAAALAGIAVPLAAEAPVSTEISTDRPDFTEATDTVAVGTLQFEGGLLLSGHALEPGPERDLGGPVTLIRTGLTNRAELRLGADGFTSESASVYGHREHHSGGADPDIGIKIRLRDERKYIPAVAMIGSISIPVGSEFSSRLPIPEAELCWSKSLPGGFETGGNVNFRRITSSSVTEHAVSLTVSHRLGRGFDIYSEGYRVSPIENDEPAHWIANSGLSRLLGKNAQIDVEAGHTISARTPYWFVGAGFAIRRAFLAR